MIKIAEIWGLGFDKLARELEISVENVNGILLDFLCEIRYKFEHPSFYKIFDIAYQHNIPITILTPYLREMPPLLDFNNPKYKNIKMIHWETFWFNRTYEAWKYHDELNTAKGLEMFNLRFGENISEFKYPYITLNNISKDHRCHIMDLLAKHNLIDLGAIVWRDIRRNCDDIRHTFADNITDSVFYGYPYKYWTPKRMFLDQGIEFKNQETLPIEFNSSFMQLVTESDNEVLFHSEKTATPILLNKIFLIAGVKGQHNQLKKLGFKLYDEIFDYSFDDIDDENIRYEKLVENIKRISNKPLIELKKIHHNLFEKIVYNKQHALNLINNIPSEIYQVVDMIKQENTDPYTGPLNILL